MPLNVTIKDLSEEEEVRNRAVIYARYSSEKQKEASIEQQKRYRGTRSDARIEYILRGKLFCGICGTEMIANSGRSKNGEMYYYIAIWR